MLSFELRNRDKYSACGVWHTDIRFLGITAAIVRTGVGEYSVPGCRTRESHTKQPAFPDMVTFMPFASFMYFTCIGTMEGRAWDEIYHRWRTVR